MAEDPDVDRIVEFEVGKGETAGVFTLFLKTKTEGFDVIGDRKTFQELADEIYRLLDESEPKSA
ncbi:MAG TPA: hypothetical protein VKT73_05490 [Xanthobacteraceae bacterium]|nr:hypothetical protein [Xanthobacteraceae bacterium]